MIGNWGENFNEKWALSMYFQKNFEAGSPNVSFPRIKKSPEWIYVSFLKSNQFFSASKKYHKIFYVETWQILSSLKLLIYNSMRYYF